MADDITIKVGFDGKAAQQGLAGLPAAAQKAGQATAKGLTTPVSDGLGKMQKQAEQWGMSLIKRFFGIQAAVALVNKGIEMANASLTEQATISKNAKKSGLSAEDYQAASRAAEETGVSIDAISDAMKKTIETTKLATEGNIEAVKALQDLGFTNEEVRSGHIRTSDVLARISKQYRAGTTEAEKYRAATSLLGEKVGSAIVGTLGTGPSAMVEALNKPGRSQAQVDQAAAIAKEDARTSAVIGDQLSSIWEAFQGTQYRAAGNYIGSSSFNLDENEGFGKQSMAVQAASKRYEAATDPKEKAKLKEELLATFATAAEQFRAGFTGSTQGGVKQTAEMINAQLDQRLVEILPEFKTQIPATGATEPKSTELVQAVSSMQSIGGGGGFYTGATSMVAIAEQQLSAAERTAAAVERIANGGGAPPSSGVVSSN